MAKYDLCPRCGAVTKDGICTTCGYGQQIQKNNVEQTEQLQNNQNVQNNQYIQNNQYVQNNQYAQNGQYVQNNQYTQNNQYAQNNGYTQNVQGQQGVSYAQNFQGQQGAQYTQNGRYVQQGTYNQPVNGQYGNGSYQYQVPGKKMSSGAVIGLIVGTVVAIMIFALIIAVTVSSVRKRNGYSTTSAATSNSSVSDWNSGDDYNDYFENWDNHYGNLNYSVAEYMLDDEDEFGNFSGVTMTDSYYTGNSTAYDFEDYFNSSVSYDVEVYGWNYNNDNGQLNSGSDILPNGFIAEGKYYKLVNTGLVNEDDINRLIYEKSLEAVTMGEQLLSTIREDLNVYSECITYITYNDNNTISLAFDFSSEVIFDKGTNSESRMTYYAHISSLNIDMKTGREIKANETFDFTGDFCKRFMDKCASQNGSEIDFLTESQVGDILLDDESVFWVYTPVGLEVGVNATDYTGWATCSFPDYSDFIKIY